MGAKRKVAVDIEDVHQYLMYWYDTESFRDFNIMMDEGQTDLAAYHILNSGALEGSDPCPERDEAVRLGRRFEKLSRKKQDAIYNETFQGARIHECLGCNRHEFVDKWNRDIYPDANFETCGECGSKAVLHRDWDESDSQKQIDTQVRVVRDLHWKLTEAGYKVSIKRINEVGADLEVTGKDGTAGIQLNAKDSPSAVFAHGSITHGTSDSELHVRLTKSPRGRSAGLQGAVESVQGFIQPVRVK